jgi:hypothetical protein
MVYATLGKKVDFRAGARPEERSFRLLLGRDEAEFPATPADIGVLPVPMESGIDLAIVASDPTKTKEHPTNARDSEKQQNSDRVSQ